MTSLAVPRTPEKMVTIPSKVLDVLWKLFLIICPLGKPSSPHLEYVAKKRCLKLTWWVARKSYYW